MRAPTRSTSLAFALLAVQCNRAVPPPRAARDVPTGTDGGVPRPLAPAAHLDLSAVVAVGALPVRDSADGPRFRAISATATGLMAETGDVAERLRALRDDVMVAQQLRVTSAQNEAAAYAKLVLGLRAEGWTEEATAIARGDFAAFDAAVSARIYRGRGDAEWEPLMRQLDALRESALGGIGALDAVIEQMARTRGRVQRVAFVRALVVALGARREVQLPFADMERTGGEVELRALIGAIAHVVQGLNAVDRARVASALLGANALPATTLGVRWVDGPMRDAHSGVAALAHALVADAAAVLLPPWVLDPDPPITTGVAIAGLAAARTQLDAALGQATGAPPPALTMAAQLAATQCNDPFGTTLLTGTPGVARFVFDNHVVEPMAHRSVGSLSRAPVQRVDGDALFRHCGDGTLQARSLTDGRLLWTTSSSAPCDWLVRADTQLACVSSGSLATFAVADGKAGPAWSTVTPRVRDVATLGNMIALLMDDLSVRFLEARTGAEVQHTAPAPSTAGNARQTLRAFDLSRLFCTTFEDDERLRLACYDARGAQRWAKTVPTSTVITRNGQQVREVYLHVAEQGLRHILAKSFFVGPLPRSIVFAVADGSVALDVPIAVGGIVERSNGALEGALALDTPAGTSSTTLSLLAPTSGAVRFKSVVPARGNTTAALVEGNRLVVALYERIAMTSFVTSLDMHTGAPAWSWKSGGVVMGHSQYSNEVTLEHLGTDALVRGYEAGGAYFTSLDLATGARTMLVLPDHCATPGQCFGW